MEATSMMFLLEVGRWAMTELKERWTLRRKTQELQIAKMSEQEIEDATPSLIADMSVDQGAINVERTLERIHQKRDLIEGWKDSLVADQKQQQLGEMQLGTLNARKRDFEGKIKGMLREIESDLKSLGFSIEIETEESS